jgi:hypothetical protein
MNTVLGDQLLRRVKRGETIKVPVAKEEDLAGLRPEFSKCHENVARWCAQHQGHKPVRGWLITSSATIVKHSVVDIGGGDLLDVTPLYDGFPREFLRHVGSEELFASYPAEVIVIGL